jgi:hypothetical protein
MAAATAPLISARAAKSPRGRFLPVGGHLMNLDTLGTSTMGARRLRRIQSRQRFRAMR